MSHIFINPIPDLDWIVQNLHEYAYVKHVSVSASDKFGDYAQLEVGSRNIDRHQDLPALEIGVASAKAMLDDSRTWFFFDLNSYEPETALYEAQRLIAGSKGGKLISIIYYTNLHNHVRHRFAAVSLDDPHNTLTWKMSGFDPLNII